MIESLVENKIHHIIINRPEERNAFTINMLRDLARAYTESENNENIRVTVVYARGNHFTLGLDLPEVSAWIQKNRSFPVLPDQVNPFGTSGKNRTKPVVVAAHGFTFTLGIELMLAGDIRICAEKTTFSQMETGRGIIPFGGATIQFPRLSGWGNAMRYLLTGDQFDAKEAHRIGLVQEIVKKKDLITRAMGIAEKIASNAPLAVRATMEAARMGVRSPYDEAVDYLMPKLLELMETRDAQEGMASFMEKRPPVYRGE